MMGAQLAFWTFWTFVAGQNGDISWHTVQSAGSSASWQPPAEKTPEPFACRSTVQNIHCPGRMLRAKKVTFLGTAPGPRLSNVSRS